MSPVSIVASTIVAGIIAWSGPEVRPVWNADGVSGLSVGGEVSAPGFLVGNTQGGLADDWAAWRVELANAAAAGVRVFGICTDGSDLLSFPEVALTNHTRQMVSLVLEVVPHALILPRVPIGTVVGGASRFDRVQVMAPAVCVGCPPWPPSYGNGTPGSLMPQPYGSMTNAWAAAAASRTAQWLKLLDGAFPGSIAGVHLAGLAAGEMRFESPPEDAGMADYSETTVAEFCSEQEGPVSCKPPSATDRCTPPEGNIFVSNASAAFNLFISRQVQCVISATAAAAKAAMDHKGMVIAFYGYLNELGGHRAAASGHLALAALLRDIHIDGIVSPYKYGPAFRSPTGPLVGMGPFDCGVVHKKLWISEDDSRTSFAKPSMFTSCTNSTCDTDLLRRNIITTALHGAGIYQFDLVVAGWFGRAGAGQNTSATAAIWNAISSGRKAAETIFRAGARQHNSSSGSADASFQPEIAVFVDDTSLGHMRANGVGTLDATVHPASWLNDLAWQISQVGAPVRHLHLRDLLLPKQINPILQNIKLAVFPNAFTLTNELKSAITKLHSQHRTMLYYYAPNALNTSGGLSPNGDEVGKFMGYPIIRGKGNHTLVSEFVPTVASSWNNVSRATGGSNHIAIAGPRNRGCPNFGSLAGQHYQPTFSGQPGPTHGPSAVLDPFYHLDESGDHAVESGCEVFARYANIAVEAGKTARSSTLPAAGVCCTKSSHTSIFTASPLPPEALRRVAVAAGVHLYLNTTVGTATEPTGLPTTTCTGDGIEVSGSGVLVRAGHQALADQPRAVSLPANPNGWLVADEQGQIVCRHCHGFQVALNAGESAAFVVTRQ